MDEDFQQRYQAAERAYGAGQYDEAHEIATALLDQLSGTAKDPEEEKALLGWRAFVALLLGHIELYGLEQPSQASAFFQTVLASQPHDTLRELAQQGLKRAADMTAPKTSTPINEPSINEPPSLTPETPTTAPADILRDPFLPEQPVNSQGQTAATNQSSAMPWLDQMTAASPEPTPAASAPEPVVEPNPPVEPDPGDPDPGDPDPGDPDPSESDPSDPDPMDLLAGSLLRVKLPAQFAKSEAGEAPADSPGSSWLQRLLRRR